MLNNKINSYKEKSLNTMNAWEKLEYMAKTKKKNSNAYLVDITKKIYTENCIKNVLVFNK
jgi:hypothetical protein